MRRFAQLYTELDQTTWTSAKVKAAAAYLRAAAPEDAVWALRLLMGRKPRQALPTARLRRWAAEAAGIPAWLFEASYEVVGDLAETITLLLPPGSDSGKRPLHRWIEDVLLPLRAMPEERQRAVVTAAWHELGSNSRLLWNKLITGGFRVGVSRQLVIRALAQVSGVAEPVIAHRLMGDWEAAPQFWERLVAPDTTDAKLSHPYPFFLACPLPGPPDALGDISAWQAEWKWDGIRTQLIRRCGQVFIWSRGEELVTDKFPEIGEAAQALPDGCALDGEILAWQDGRPIDFAALQQRIGRKHLGPALLRSAPVILMAYDLLELNGTDVRTRDLAWRTAALNDILGRRSHPCLLSSPPVSATNWTELARLRGNARGRGVEGLMLKRRSAAYGVGRRRGDWWKWKVDPLSVDAVLTYAQRGHGRRAGLFTDYTFSVRKGEGLVPFAKAYSGLTDREIREVDRFIRANTIERFGPVRAVAPKLVFEIAFEEIRRSPRHRSGVAVRFPRIARWRNDKTADDADTLETLRALLSAAGAAP